MEEGTHQPPNHTFPFYDSIQYNTIQYNVHRTVLQTKRNETKRTNLFILQHCQFVAGNVPRDWPGYDFDPDTGTLASASATRNSTRGKGSGGLHIAVSIFIGLAVSVVVALVGFFVVRKIRNREIGSATQNSTRDHSEAVNKLEPDGGVMQGALASFARTPNSTIKSKNNNTNQQEQEPFDAKSLANGLSDDTSVEMGFYSDKPLSHPKNGSRGRDLL